MLNTYHYRHKANAGFSSLSLLIGLLMLQIFVAIIFWAISAYSLNKQRATVLFNDEQALTHWQTIDIKSTKKINNKESLTSTLKFEQIDGRWTMPQLDKLLVDQFRLKQTIRGLSQQYRLTKLGEGESVQARFATTPSLHQAAWSMTTATGEVVKLYWGKRVSAQSIAVRRANSEIVYQWLQKNASEADRWENLAHEIRGWVDPNQFAVPGGRTRLVEIKGRDFSLVRPIKAANSRKNASTSSQNINAGNAAFHIKSIAPWQWADKTLEKDLPVIDSQKMSALSEALGELLIADILPSHIAADIRATKPINELSFKYQKSKLNSDGSNTITIENRAYTLYRFGSEVAIDFGEQVMVIPAISDGKTLTQAYRANLIKH